MTDQNLASTISLATLTPPPLPDSARAAQVGNTALAPDALAAATATGITEGRTAERARIKAIVTAPEAKGREAMAMHLAFSSDMASDAAIDLLKVSPVQAPAAGGSRLDQLMQDPKVTANVVPPQDPVDQASAGLAAAVDQFIATMR